MTLYTYWVEAVYCIKDNEKRISFPDFGTRIEPFRIKATDNVKDTAAEVLRTEIQKMLDNAENLPPHNKEFSIDTRFTESSHIEILKVTAYLS